MSTQPGVGSQNDRNVRSAGVSPAASGWYGRPARTGPCAPRPLRSWPRPSSSACVAPETRSGMRPQTTHLFAILVAVALFAAALAAAAPADDSVVNSKHDLSAFGPGPVRALTESEVCIFCHAPHNTDPATPLWNRYQPTTHYRIYDSSTTDARIDQPGGSSKMCLSCHDGSIAVGLVLSRPPTDPIPMNHPLLPSGPSNLTNDLSDDHPIGLRYDRALSNRDPQLRPPELVSHAIQLGRRGELECIACHDPHNNELGDFLRITDRQSALCVTCHDMNGWRTSAHALSSANVPIHVTNGEALPYRSLRDNACATCHAAHNATQNERLLRARSYDLCIGCHDGLSARDVLSASNQRSGHQPHRLREVHDPAENPLTMRPHVECVDCHNPHAVRENPLAFVAPAAGRRSVFVPPAMEHVPGVSLAGVPVERATFYYEVCFRCHADNPVPIANRIQRQRDDWGNIRRQFLPTAASTHPIAAGSLRSDDVPSLVPEQRLGAPLSCQDCHNNADARQLGGSSANGPHGSRYDFLLLDRYETADFTTETPQAYALCYRCHDRNSILNNESFPFHREHVVRGHTPCSSCHTAHGVDGSRSQHSHLINFDVSIVQGERLFVDLGQRAGTCTLTCHGVRHVNFNYGPSSR